MYNLFITGYVRWFIEIVSHDIHLHQLDVFLYYQSIHQLCVKYFK